MSTKKLDSLLNPNNHGDLGDIIKRAQRMGELTDIVARALPKIDRTAVIAANLRDDGELVVICTSPAWASRLRYETNSILKAVQDCGINANKCRVRVTNS